MVFIMFWFYGLFDLINHLEKEFGHEFNIIGK